MNIFVLVFLGLMIFGGVQAWLWQRQQQRMQRLHSAEHVPAQSVLSRRVSQNPIGKRLKEIFNDLRFNLLGKQRSVAIQHLVIVLLAQVGGVYINEEYLHLNLKIVLVAVFCLTIYALYLRSKKKLRTAFEMEFSEALNIINSSIRAGNSVIQGIEQCGEKLEGVVGEEFRQVSQRLEIGEEVENVFMDSYERLPYREYYFFIIAVMINMKGGGQVKEVMSRLGGLITNNRIMDRKKYAKTSEIRMSIKILTAIPIGFFFYIKFQSPANFDILLYHPIGQMMLYYSISSILLGLLIVWMMMNKI